VVREKIRDAWNRDAKENPEVDWSISTDETRNAESTLNAMIIFNERGDVSTETVRDAYRDWVRVQIEASKPKLLFEF
jgi:hypothetical protein